MRTIAFAVISAAQFWVAFGASPMQLIVFAHVFGPALLAIPYAYVVLADVLPVADLANCFDLLVLAIPRSTVLRPQPA